jgi:hypothetical protein
LLVNPVPPFVVGTVGNLSDAKVPEEMLVAFKDVKLAPLAVGSVAGNLASGTVPEDKLSAFKFVNAEPFAAGKVAGNLASGLKLNYLHLNLLS